MNPPNKKAGSCGICVPCLFRRASLHANEWDDEAYGRHLELFNAPLELPDDPLALIAFQKRNLSDRDLAAGLLANGRVRMEKLSEYVDLVKRMRKEVLTWLHAVGTPNIIEGLPDVD